MFKIYYLSSRSEPALLFWMPGAANLVLHPLLLQVWLAPQNGIREGRQIHSPGSLKIQKHGNVEMHLAPKYM